MLGLPKGGRQGDETPEQTAAREVREETGITVDVYQETTKVWTTDELDLDRASLEIRFAPLFAD